MRGPLLALATLALLGATAEPNGWTVMAPMLVPQCEAETAVVDGRLYVMGGWTELAHPMTTVQVYDRATNVWRFGVPMPEAIHHGGAVVVGHVIYIVGGFTLPFGQREPMAHVWAFDVRTQRWSARAPMPAPRGAMVVAAIGNLIYAAGGEHRRPPGKAIPPGANPTYEPVTDLTVYDTRTDRWQTLPPMKVARDHAFGGAIDGNIYVMGGRDRPVYDLTAAEEYVPRASEWLDRAPMITGRSGGHEAIVGERLFTFGGEGNKQSPLGIYDQVEAYDAVTNTWTAYAPMPHPRHSTSIATVDSRIFVAGGVPKAGGDGALNLLEAFDPYGATPVGVPR